MFTPLKAASRLEKRQVFQLLLCSTRHPTLDTSERYWPHPLHVSLHVYINRNGDVCACALLSPTRTYARSNVPQCMYVRTIASHVPRFTYSHVPTGYQATCKTLQNPATMSEERHFPNPSLREPACLPAAQPEPSKPGEVASSAYLHTVHPY